MSGTGSPGPSRVAVVARSFVRNAALRHEIRTRYPDAVFADAPGLLEGDELIAFLRGHERAIVGLERVDDRVLDALPELKVISKYGVGLDGIDVAALARRGIRLGWSGGVNRRSVAELTLAFALALVHRVPETSMALRQGRWDKLVGQHLSGRTVGIIGCGFVGKEVVTLLAPFGCRVLAHDIRDYADFYRAHGVTALPLADLLRQSEIVTLHVPLDRSTMGMIDEAALALMPKESFLINAARGGLVDEDALAGALERGHLAGAAFDVFATEPEAYPRLLAQPTFLGTPHIGAGAREAQLAMGRAAIEGLETARVPDGTWPPT